MEKQKNFVSRGTVSKEQACKRKGCSSPFQDAQEQPIIPGGHSRILGGTRENQIWSSCAVIVVASLHAGPPTGPNIKGDTDRRKKGENLGVKGKTKKVLHQKQVFVARP